MIRNLLLLASSILVGLVLMEAASRFFIALPRPYVNSPDLVVRGEDGSWILRPGYAGVMDNGVDFRDVQISVGDDGGRNVACREQARGAARIFLIGDSQTFGQGLSDSDTWASRLQCRLVERGGAPRVHNLGVPGVNVDSYAQRLRQVLPALRRGDRVVVAVTWNDLHSDVSAGDIEHARRALANASAGGKTDDFRARPVMPYKPLAKETWRYRFYSSTGIFVPRLDGVKAFADSMLYVSPLYGLLYPRIKELVYRLRPPDSVFAKIPEGTFERNFDLLALMRDVVRPTGAAFDVVLLPNRVFFDAAYYATYSQNGRVFPQQDFPGYLARRACPDRGLRCTSMFPYLATDTRDAHTFAFDGHYNAAGARRVAEGVFRAIAGEGG